MEICTCQTGGGTYNFSLRTFSGAHLWEWNGERKLESRLCCEGSPLLSPIHVIDALRTTTKPPVFTSVRLISRCCAARLTRSFLVKSNFDMKNRAWLELSLREFANEPRLLTSVRFLFDWLSSFYFLFSLSLSLFFLVNPSYFKKCSSNEGMKFSRN